MGLADDIVKAGSADTDPAALLARLQGMERERDDLRAALNQAHRVNRTEEFVRAKLEPYIESLPPSPTWLTEVRTDPGYPGVPVLFLSDLHIGEVVRAAEMNGVNAYNSAVAAKRLRAVVETAAELWQRHLHRACNYDGVVVLLGGDIVSGIIHAELQATNDKEIMVQVLDATALLWEALKYLETIFGRIDVYTVPGNHGRTSMKPRFKGYAGTSFDWLIYQMLTKFAAASGAKITVYGDENRQKIIPIPGVTTLLVHGDQFRGGDGIIGPVGPVTRGDVRMRDIASLLPGEHTYDLLVYGHHHRAGWSHHAIGNGSLIGYNEYAAGNVLRYERPIQMAWTCHPRHGVNWITPIYAPACEDLWD